MSTTRDKIRSADDIETETVEVPEWGVTVRVRSMSAADRAATFAEANANNNNLPDLDSFWGRVMVECILEADTNERVFQPSDVEWLLSDKSAEVISRLSEICMKVSGLTKDAVDEAGKGSSDSETERTESAPFTSVSPATSA